MYDNAYKAYTNLKIPTMDSQQQTKEPSSGLLARTQKPMADQPSGVDDERTRVGKYVAQIRAKREALKNNGRTTSTDS